MQNLPFALVLLSSIAHGYWNFLLKRAQNKDAFLGLSKLAEPVIYAIPFGYAVSLWGLDPLSLWYAGVGTLLSVANYYCLANSYKRLDLSIAYPVSRSSTLFLPFLAFIFFQEQLDVIGWCSVILVTLGVLVIQLKGLSLSGISLGSRDSRTGMAFALLAAFLVALYTLWGKQAVQHIHPFIYMYCYTFASCAYFWPSLRRLDRRIVKQEWQRNKWSILSVSVLNTLSFVLMLMALNMGKVTYVGALRQLSLVVGVGLGWVVLRESCPMPRVLGVLLIIVGACLTYLAK
ncbi:EamA family transporter [Pseudodesulfovibrio sp. JC047]|uniref:EamA family transporter n=1 Tax=Pseudodesulfovibrio sp. JC047 TaxID=2683199 RepID=UPI0013D5B69C|nr:EamA family transporter [Pseudodesulfovibrio sp. JC047]NDV20784.1 EamA family transporter [Pseudodesulfovibrio sp. JC047]